MVKSRSPMPLVLLPFPPCTRTGTRSPNARGLCKIRASREVTCEVRGLRLGRNILMNYTDFFRLRAHPFNLTPDLKFYYRSEPQRKALAYLNFGLSKGEGFV